MQVCSLRMQKQQQAVETEQQVIERYRNKFETKCAGERMGKGADHVESALQLHIVGLALQLVVPVGQGVVPALQHYTRGHGSTAWRFTLAKGLQHHCTTSREKASVLQCKSSTAACKACWVLSSTGSNSTARQSKTLDMAEATHYMQTVLVAEVGASFWECSVQECSRLKPENPSTQELLLA